MKEKGFTIIELIIALSIIIVALLGVLSLLTYINRVNESDREDTLARSAIFAKIEEMKAHEFDNLLADYSAGGSPGNTFDVEGLYNSQGTITIDSTNPNLLLVEITVSWEGINGPRSISSSTLITR